MCGEGWGHSELYTTTGPTACHSPLFVAVCRSRMTHARCCTNRRLKQSGWGLADQETRLSVDRYSQNSRLAGSALRNATITPVKSPSGDSLDDIMAIQITFRRRVIAYVMTCRQVEIRKGLGSVRSDGLAPERAVGSRETVGIIIVRKRAMCMRGGTRRRKPRKQARRREISGVGGREAVLQYIMMLGGLEANNLAHPGDAIYSRF